MPNSRFQQEKSLNYFSRKIQYFVAAYIQDISPSLFVKFREQIFMDDLVYLWFKINPFWFRPISKRAKRINPNFTQFYEFINPELANYTNIRLNFSRQEWVIDISGANESEIVISATWTAGRGVIKPAIRTQTINTTQSPGAHGRILHAQFVFRNQLILSLDFRETVKKSKSMANRNTILNFVNKKYIYVDNIT